MKKILVTGAAGFIGSYLTKKLVDNDYFVIGIDNMNDYYDVSLKENRIKEVQNDNFVFIKEDLVNEDKIREIFEEYKPNIVVNLAGSAGVRYSSINSDEYIKNNILGFYNILNISKDFDVEHFIFFSSSSIYGNNKNKPFKESDISLNQESIYASTKMCNEVIACSYSKIYNIDITAIRPFTVYGPFGRPDMAYYKFINKLLNEEEISIYHNGDLKRDYTYITDAIDGIYNILISNPKDRYNVYNIGRGKQYSVNELVSIIKKELIENKIVDKDFDFDKYIKYTNTPKGEVYETLADITKMKNEFNYNPSVSLEEGIIEFIKWYKNYYNI